MLRLNLACGSNIKNGFINIDKWNRNKKIDIVCDLTKDFPFYDKTVDYIYCSHFLEHLNWLEKKKFLSNCYKCLKNKSKLRLVLPNYKKIFKKYLEGDDKYFEVFKKALNDSDYKYYFEVYKNPEKIKQERKNNLPPDWHFSLRFRDRERVLLRVRHYEYNIEILDWFCHQYNEHKSLLDYESLEGILTSIGFSEIKQTEIKDIDSHAPTRITSSLYIECIK